MHQYIMFKRKHARKKNGNGRTENTEREKKGKIISTQVVVQKLKHVFEEGRLRVSNLKCHHGTRLAQSLGKQNGLGKSAENFRRFRSSTAAIFRGCTTEHENVYTKHFRILFFRIHVSVLRQKICSIA